MPETVCEQEAEEESEFFDNNYWKVEARFDVGEMLKDFF